MVITTTPRFESEMQGIFDFIAKDSKERAKKFRQELSSKIKNLLIFPYIGRIRSSNVREFIYKDYVVPYTINNDEISILGIYKENEWSE
ncbi:MAG: type II toxin-antitoxin system RelE/ParE family toxin [Campylobacter sp.]|uniref:type II toxin-antitoxin system RelE/ParE family toxin n=1 Tax=Campylobacter sp. TaxID=205 RepID=UPI002AA805B9|nr:type II toxin-antitoxin system RelE/ParE family toxin [Campylobacter sp.]MCI7501651.1 type II toxin-antitoxin system RelE/ParE family toxin [Campylobacter sp.]